MRIFITRLISFFMLICSLSVDAVTQAYVDAGEVGQGFLMRRLDTCYLISPAHVIGHEFYAAIKTDSIAKSSGEAETLETFGYDLTLLSVQGGARNDCSTDINAFKPIDNILTSVTTLNLNSVNPDGSQSYIPLDITDAGIQYLRVKARSSDLPLYKGLSGSLVYSGKVPVGMLQSIDADTLEGIVLRIDRVIATIRPFFEINASSKSLVKSVESNVNTRGKNSLSMIPLEWSEPPLDASHRMAHLFDQDPDTVWGVKFSGQAVSIEMDISDGKKAQTFMQLTMQVQEKGEATIPKDFEVLFSRKSSGRRGWLNISSATWLKNSKEKTLNFAPVKAKRLKIIFYSNWGADTVKLSALSAE